MRTSYSLVLAAAMLAGCAGGGGGGGSASPGSNELTFRDSDTSGGKPIKISYVRFVELTDPQTGKSKFVHQYRYMLSQGWMNLKGPKAHEPFERIWRDAFVAHSVADPTMEEIVRNMMSKGFGELRETQVDQRKIDEIRRIEKTLDKVAGQRTRYITVETDNYKRTVCYLDNDDSKPPTQGRPGTIGPLTQKFCDVESVINPVLGSYTILVGVQNDSTMPRGKR